MAPEMAPEARPTLAPDQLVPQTAAEHPMASDPAMTTKQATSGIIEEHIRTCSSKKYGDFKKMLLPTAATLEHIRISLNCIETGADIPPMEDVPVLNKANWKNKCKTQYLSKPTMPGVVFKRDNKEDEVGRYVVPREQIHAVLVWAHRQLGHKSGRDATYNYIKAYYSMDSLPKGLIQNWLNACPTCITAGKKSGAKKQTRQTGLPTLTRPAGVSKTTGRTGATTTPLSDGQLREVVATMPALITPPPTGTPSRQESFHFGIEEEAAIEKTLQEAINAMDDTELVEVWQPDTDNPYLSPPQDMTAPMEHDTLSPEDFEQPRGQTMATTELSGDDLEGIDWDSWVDFFG
ncbi:hypothetical protein MMC13_005969 [Lambiella insularis]|nr:hypothetical protein [Lambiella insularis]